jgi:hypothetical protein
MRRAIAYVPSQLEFWFLEAIHGMLSWRSIDVREKVKWLPRRVLKQMRLANYARLYHVTGI